MWTSSRLVLQDLVREFNKVTYPTVRCFSQTTSKNTVVVERWWQVPLSKEGRPPRLYPRRHQVYRVVEDTKHKPKEKMELILTQTVPKLGGRGDTVFVKKSVGRNKLLAQNLAVYPSPENKDMFAEELRLLHEGKPEDRIQTRTGLLTMNYFKSIQLKVEKITSIDYELSKEIVCRQILRKRGVVVPVHALRLPDEPIKDHGDYWCEITMNGIDTVRIPMSVVPFEDRSARHRILQKQMLEQADDAVDSEITTEAGVLEAAVLDEAPKPLTADDAVTAGTVVIDSPTIEVTEVGNAQPAQKAVSSVATEPSASEASAPGSGVTSEATALEAGVTPEATALEARVTPEATALEAGVTPEATALEAGVTPEATALEAGVTPEAIALEGGVTREATALEAGVTPEATALDAGVIPETAALGAGVTQDDTAPPAFEVEVAPEAAAPPAFEVEVAPEAAAPSAFEVEVAPEAAAPPAFEVEVAPEAAAPPAFEVEVAPEAAAPPAFEVEVAPEAAAPPAFEVEVASECETPSVSEAQAGPAVATPTSPGFAAPSSEETVSEAAVGPSLAIESSGVPPTPEEKETATEPETLKEGKVNSVTKTTKDD